MRANAFAIVLFLTVLGMTVTDPLWGRVGAVAGLGLLIVRSWRLQRAGEVGGPVEPLIGAVAVVIGLLGATAVEAPSSINPEAVEWQTATRLLTYPLLAWVLMGLAALRRQPSRIDSVVTGALGGLSAGMAAWIALSNWASAPLDAVDQLVVVVPLALDVFALLVSLRLFRTIRPVFSWWTLNGAIGALLAADVLMLAAAIRPAELAGATGACRGVACILLAVTFLHASAGTLIQPAIIEPRPFGFGHMSVVVVAALATPATLLVQAQMHRTLPFAVAVGAGGVSVVLALYLVDLLRDRSRSEHRVNHDRLTGLPNRTLFVDRVERALAHARRADSQIAVFFIDVDRFKAINDRWGHAAGDSLLHVVAGRLQSCLRDEDTVARISGDEFAVLLPNLASAPASVSVAERIMSAFSEPVTIADCRLAVTASMGVAIGPADGDDPDSLLACADAAMYRAKDAGRNTFEIWDQQLSDGAHSRLETETALLRAVEREELVVYYQPIVDLATGRIVSAEALVRWNHPEHGILMPGQFVPVAEQSDLVVEIGEQVLHAACLAAFDWTSKGLGDVSVSVNVASRQFRYDLARAVTSALRISGLPPERLMLELTESAAVDNIDVVAATFDDLRQFGIRAAIDDFGTGYCGLRYLSTLPVDNLKIDKSFIQAMTPANASIVAATIAMAHSLGLTVTAEGVETEEQRAFLHTRGCDRYQGYLLARPIPEPDFVQLARRVNCRPPEPSNEPGHPLFSASTMSSTFSTVSIGGR